MDLKPQKQKKKQVNKQKHKIQPKNSSNKKAWLNATNALALATAAALGIGGFLLFPFASPEKDYVSDAKKAEIVKIYEEQQQNTAPLQAITSAEEQLQAVKSMGLSPSREKQLLEQVKNNELKLVWFQAWDNQAEDGDIIEFESQGWRVKTLLKNEPVVFALPVAVGNSVITVKGVYDGGGGITSSVVTSLGTVIPPVINVGEVFTMVVK